MIYSQEQLSRLVTPIAVKYHIPEGTQSETEFRIRGQGLPRVGSSLKGDLVVHVKVEVPRRMTEKQKELLPLRAAAPSLSQG